MKKTIKILSVIMLLLCIGTSSSVAQGMKVGDMISGVFDSPLNKKVKNLFVAEVTAVNGSEFTCRFVHSNSVYVFKNLRKEDDTFKADVKSTDKGVFKDGTTLVCWIYTPTEDCGGTLKVKFKDGKVFMADSKNVGENYQLTFTHSGGKYLVSKEGKIITSGGTYPKGDYVSWECLKAIQ